MVGTWSPNSNWAIASIPAVGKIRSHKSEVANKNKNKPIKLKIT